MSTQLRGGGGRALCYSRYPKYGAHLLSARHAVGGHVEDTVHSFKGMEQGFLISDVSLKQKEEVGREV